MENAIKFLRIQNFKSIKDVTLHPKRVNLLIGEPNVGTSNMLEAKTLPGFLKVVKDDEADENPQLEKLLQAIKKAQPSGYRELATFVAEVMDRNSRLWQQ